MQPETGVADAPGRAGLTVAWLGADYVVAVGALNCHYGRFFHVILRAEALTVMYGIPYFFAISEIFFPFP